MSEGMNKKYILVNGCGQQNSSKVILIYLHLVIEFTAVSGHWKLSGNHSLLQVNCVT